ncbi:MAG: Chromate transport protein [Enterocloster aldenensis]
MIYLSLFWEFLKIGMFSFGGAYASIPLIKESVLHNGWMDEAMFSNMLAISESTPGPIMVNAATYIGSQQAGIIGAVLATLGVVLPSFIIILMVSMFLKKWIKSKGVQSVLRGVKPCLMGVILATGFYMLCSIIVTKVAFNFRGLIILALLSSLLIIYRTIKKKELSPILLIVLAAILGIVVF